VQQQQDPSQTFGDINIQDVSCIQTDLEAPRSSIWQEGNDFTDKASNQTNFNLDFTALDNPDILESFDFDTFLNTDDTPAFTFDPNITYPPDGVEAGAGDGL
jgi:hypothetical protein